MKTQKKPKTLRYVLLAILLLGTITALMFAKNKKPADKAPAPLSFSVETVTARTIPISTWTYAQGTVQASRREHLNFELPGKVVFLDPDLKDGDQVKGPGTEHPEGQLLASIENIRYAKQVEIATANLESAKQEAKAAVARNTQAQSQHKLCKKTYNRTKALYAQNIAPATELEQAMAQLEATRSTINETQSLIQSANAQVEQAQKKLSIAQTNMQKTQLRASFSGTIARINIRQGDYVPESASSTLEQDNFENAAFVLIDKSDMEAVFDIPLEHAKKIVKGQQTLLSPLVGKASPTPGYVYSISPAVNKQNRTVRVKVKIDPARNTLIDGEPVTARIQTGKAEKALCIPRQCLCYENNIPFAFTVDQQTGSAKKQQLKTGMEQKHMVEIIKGLSPGQQVVFKGQNRLFDGVRVNIKGGAFNE